MEEITEEELRSNGKVLANGKIGCKKCGWLSKSLTEFFKYCKESHSREVEVAMAEDDRDIEEWNKTLPKLRLMRTLPVPHLLCDKADQQ